MASTTSNDLKNGMTLEFPEGLFTVIEFQHVKPGKGPAFVRSKLRNLRNDAVIERTFRAGEPVEQAVLDKRDYQFLYATGSTYTFMDTSSYEQLEVDVKALGSAKNYLKENDSAMIVMHDDEIVTVELPAAVELVISETDPGVQGDRSTGGRKPATLETGLVIQVPLFVAQGERVKVDTRTGEYLTRAN